MWLIVVSLFNYILDPELTSWVVDSGASDHMTPSDSLFHQATQPFLSKPVQIPNDQFIPVTHTGHITLSDDITLKNVFMCP